MRHSFGEMHRVGDFIAASLPTSERSSSTASDVINLLQALDAIQRDNWAITFTVQAGGKSGNISVYYRGLRKFYIVPRSEAVQVLAYWPDDWICEALDASVEAGQVEDVTGTEEGSRRWRIALSDTAPLLDMLRALEVPKVKLPQDERSHPRYFPGDVRQAALTAFEKDRMCPGAKGVKRHKVPKDMPIEFDHILPYSKGGGSTLANIQVLCFSCNRSKGGTAE